MRRAAAIAFVLGIAATAAAQPSAAVQAHVDAAGSYFKVGNFEGALAEYRAAYALDPNPDYLYAMATIEDQRGGCAAAVELYQQFLDTHPPAEDVEVVQAAIDTCNAKLGVAAHEPEVTPPPKPEPLPPPPPPKPRTRRVRQPFYRDALGDVLVGAGVTGLAVGGTFYGLALDDADHAASPTTREAYDQLWQRAQDRRRVALIAAGAGAALVVGGVIRWWTADRWEVVPDLGAEHASLSIASRW